MLFRSAGFAFQRFGQSDRAMVTLVLSSAGMMWVLWQVIAPEIDKFQTPQEIASQYLKSSETNGEPFVQGMFRPSMVFYARRRIEFSATDEELGTRLNLGNPQQLPDPVIIQDPSGQGKELLSQKGYLEKETWSGFPKRGSITIFTR